MSEKLINQKNIVKLKDQEKLLSEKLVELVKERNKQLEYELKLEGEKKSLIDQRISVAQAEAAIATEMRKDLELSNKQIQKKIEALTAEYEKTEARDEQTRKALIEEQNHYIELKAIGKARRKQLDDELIAVIKQSNQLQRMAGLARGFAQDTSLALASLTGFAVDNTWETTGWGKLLTLGAEGGVGYISAAMSEQFSVSNLAGSALSKVVGETMALAVEQDNAISQFKKATGAGAAYNDVMEDSYLNTRTFGVSQAEAAQSTQELFVNMSGFSGMNEGVQTQLTETAALMSELGISAGTTAKNFEIMTKSLGMSGTQADDTARDLFSLAQSLKLPPQIVMQEFGPAMSTLSAHGDDAVRVFNGMAAASKATGIAISELLNIAGQFDQFETGAQAVGKMNAMLGGPYLNTVEMLKMSEEERIMAMMRSMEASGKQFSAMSKYERMAFANAAGIRDMAKANAIFGQSTEAYQMQLDRAKEATAQQEKLNEVVRDAQPVFDKFKLIFTNLAVSMKEPIEFFGKLADGILALQEKMGPFGGAFVAVASAVALFVIGIKAAAAIAIPAGASIGAGLSAMGTAALVGAKGLLALSAVFLVFAAGIKLAGPTLARMVETLPKIFSSLPLLLDSLTGPKVLAFTGFLAGLATFGGGAAIGLGFLALGLGKIASALDDLDGDKLQALSGITANVVKLSEVDEDKAAVAKTLIESVASLNVTAASAASPAAETLKKINELMQNLPNARGSSSPFYSPRPIDVTLMLDGDVLLNKLVPRINKEYGSK